MEKIKSKDNKKIKYIQSLKKSGKRKKEKKILIEGKNEIAMALDAGIKIDELYYCREYGQSRSFRLPMIELSKEVFESICYREKPDGFLAVAEMPENNLADLQTKEKSLFLVLESVEKPGNIGAMLRTADAVGVDAVILCDPQTDFYNPNVIRASLGAVFTVPIFSGSNEEVLAKLQKNKINIFSAIVDKSTEYDEQDYKASCAIVIGTEHEGLSDFWKDNSKANIRIPMKGKIDSLNASVSAAVILYEVYKQRKKI